MRKLMLVLVAVVAMSGCAGTPQQTYYINMDPKRDTKFAFNQDSSYCQAASIGSVPAPSMQPYQNNVSAYAPTSGTMRDQYGNVYRYQEQYNPMTAAQSHMAMAQQSFANAAIGLQNIAAQMQAEGAIYAIYNHCMSQHGWMQGSKEEIIAIEAEQGKAEAQYALGFMYGTGYGGLSKDEHKGREWVQKAALQGHAEAQYVLGDMYLRDGYGGLS
jgi:hypothetical protein